MNYFERSEISSSDIKAFLKKLGGGMAEPANLESIFSLGTLIHASILEPHLKDLSMSKEDLELANKMKNTFYKDSLCQMFIMRPDFCREEEVYGEIQVGDMVINARCKCDGLSRGIASILELKSTACNTEKSFKEAIDRLMYDMSAVLYMLLTNAKMMLIVGICKKNPDLLFKKLIKKHDETYLQGEQKLIDALKLIQQYSPEDVCTVK